ncbi:hypothetical protein T03_3529, partial [Trichinella britovi]
LIRCCHLRQLHAGMFQTLAMLRQRYWIPQRRSRVRHVIRGCLQCRWATSRPLQPSMAALLEDQTSPCMTTPSDALRLRAWAWISPSPIRGGDEESHGTEVCVSNYVHGLPCNTLGARRGDVDGRCAANSPTFHAPAGQAGDHSDRQFPLLPERRVRTASALAGDRRGPGSEIFGRTKDPVEVYPTKSAMDGRLLGALRPDHEGVSSKCSRTGAARRRRASDPPVPFQLLTGRTYADLPEVEDQDPIWHPPERGRREWNSRWRYRQQLLAKWWRRWRSGYLATLLPRWKWTSTTEGPKLNDLILILEDNVPRARCPLGVVTELFPGNDGVSRAARLRTSTAEVTRLVAKLVVLEPARISDGRTSFTSGGRM